MTDDIRTKVEEELKKRNEIIKDYKNNYFLSAGAGAGKTYTIAQRIVNQLKGGHIKADELVVITFTNKAAAELYDRISGDLAAELKEDLSDDEKNNIKEALLHIDTMTVSTIHAFCRKLLTERAFDAKIAVNAQMIEPAEERDEKKKFFEEWFLKNSDTDLIEDAIARKQEYLGTPKLWKYKDNAFDLFCKISNKMLDNELEVFCPGGPLDRDKDYEAILAGMYNNFVSEIKKFVTEALGNENADWKYILKDKDSTNALAKADSPADFVSYVCQKINKLGDVFKSQNLEGIKQRQVTVFKNVFANTVQQNISIHGTDIEDYLNYGYYAIIKTAVEAAKAYNNSRSNNRLTNDDLLCKARELLLTNSEARAYFANKYKCIYVDEYQDTDHIQSDMLWALACGNTGKLRPGSLFVVGDAKQSIYRFRGAEPEIFNQTREKMYAEGAKIESFEINFRSNPDIIKWVNAKFKDALEDTEKYADMLPFNDAGDYSDCLHGVYQFVSKDAAKRTPHP